MCQSAPPPGGVAKSGGTTTMSGNPTPAGIDYSAYKDRTPMQILGENPNGMPAGWDWGQYTAAGGRATTDGQGHSLDVRGVPIIGNGFSDVTLNRGATTAPVAQRPAAQTTVPTTPAVPTTPGVRVSGEVAGGSTTSPVTPPPVETEIAPVAKPGAPSTTAPVVPAPAVPTAPVVPVSNESITTPNPQQTYVPPSLPKMMPSATSANPVVNALMKRYKPQWWL